MMQELTDLDEEKIDVLKSYRHKKLHIQKIYNEK